MARRPERLPWRLVPFALTCPLAVSGTAAASDSASLTVPIVISSAGLAGSFYTSELSLTNRGNTTATIRFTYTAAFGGGGGTAADTLAAGRQKTVPDAVQYLISIGVPIPASGNRGGVLRVDFTGLSSSDAAAATARTTTAVPGGRAGLSYPAFGAGIGGTSYLCGLRQDAADRSNVALLNAGGGAGDIVLRLTAFSGAAGATAPYVFPDLTLAPGAFRQYTEILKDAGLDRGWVQIERVSGTAPYYAYATILDQSTSDGSFVPPLSEKDAYEASGLTLPVVVETSAFSTEVVLANVSASPQTVRLVFVADAVQTPDSNAAVSISLAAGEQKVIPAFVQYLRDQGVPGVGSPGATFAGALHLTASEDTGGVFLGGRTQTSGGGGRYGLFYTAVAHGMAATSAAWLSGLQQNAENRTNLAIVNTGETDSSTVGLRVDLYDGDTGSIAKSFDVSLAPRKWTQINGVLTDTGIANGYARVSRTSGTNPFLAYAVVVDGGQPQARSDDGAFVSFQVQEPPPSAELLAIRKVEEKSRSLRSAGVSRLDYVRAVAAFMATLPDYAVSGVDEASLTAYGVFQNGRLHVVTNNRTFDEIPQGFARASQRRILATTELPGSGYARLMQSFGETRLTQEPVYQLAAPLENPGGYVVRAGRNGDARLSTLRTVSGDGYFYFNTHGGPAWKTADKSGPRFYSLWSSTLVTPSTELQADIKADMDAGRLTYFQASTFNTRFNPVTGQQEEIEETHYGITGDFVRTYWRFSPDSIVFLNACYSAYTATPDGASEFIDACWSAGAGVYFGWSNVVSSSTCFPAARYFVDRLIGANKFMKENPDQRAFPWELVYDDMKSRGLTHDGSGAELKPFPRAGGNSVVLDPSIQELLVNEYDEELNLKGYFGSKKGKVTVGNGELVVKTWAQDAVVCALPSTGPGANGDVTVEIPGELGRRRKSNVRQLTEWDIPLHYLWTDIGGTKGLKFEGNGKLRFRADVGSYRKKPHEAPIFPLRGMAPTKDSSLPLTGSGSNSEDSSCTQTLSGSGVFPSSTGGAPLALVLGAAAKVDANTPHLGGLGLAFGAAGALPFKITFSGAGCSGSNPVAPTFGLLDGPDVFPSPQEGRPAIPLPGLSLAWDGQFRIPATKRIDGSAGGEITVEWTQAVEPIPPLEPDLAR